MMTRQPQKNKNPAQNNMKEPKLGYVVKMDNHLWLSSGTYGPSAIASVNSRTTQK